MEPYKEQIDEANETLKKILEEMKGVNENISLLRKETNHDQRRIATRLEEALAAMNK